MEDQPKSSPVVVGKNNFVYADGVKVFRLIPERGVVQIVDPDRRRCAQKGRETVEIRLSDLAKLTEQK